MRLTCLDVLAVPGIAACFVTEMTRTLARKIPRSLVYAAVLDILDTILYGECCEHAHSATCHPQNSRSRSPSCVCMLMRHTFPKRPGWERKCAEHDHQGFYINSPVGEGVRINVCRTQYAILAISSKPCSCHLCSSAGGFHSVAIAVLNSAGSACLTSTAVCSSACPSSAKTARGDAISGPAASINTTANKLGSRMVSDSGFFSCGCCRHVRAWHRRRRKDNETSLDAS